MEDAEPVVASRARPAFDLEAQVPLTVAAVAARLGVAPSTLRTWDRRYGLGPSGRAAGSHRRYTADDVARLETMRRLTLAGAAPSDAARVAADSAPFLVAVPSDTTAAAPAETPVFVDALTLAAAAANGEEPRVRRMAAWVVRERGAIEAWSEVGHPALVYLAERDPADRPGRDPEYLLAGAVLAALRAGVDEHPPPSPGRRGALLVADPGRPADHLAAHVLAAALGERGVGARVVRWPDETRIRRAVDAGTCAVLAVVGTVDGGTEIAREVAERDGLAVFMVGTDGPDVWLPGVHRVRTYEGALHEIASAVAAAHESPDGRRRPTS